MPSFTGSPVAARPGETANTLRLLGYLALSVILIVLDTQAGGLPRFRAQAERLAEPVWAIAALPGRLAMRMQEGLASRSQLLRENRDLRNELLIANARLIRLHTAALDNAQLRELLGVGERSGMDVQLVHILDIDLAPSRQRLILDAGKRDDVRVGQPVVDAGGLMGQVISVTPMYSTVLLLTDPDHAVPVTVARNGVRLIVYGNGSSLELRDVPMNTDVRVGDSLITSGLGGGFPPGFPVATVTELRPDDSQAFLVGDLAPAAHLDRGRDVLLLRAEDAIPSPAVAAPDEDDAPVPAACRSAHAATDASVPPADAPAAPRGDGR
ncbi:MAG: rod shape-determining protein MreC [Xanthomonadaceae bacterium]|nr:rod shape-determining protein MreC [Xanthomonadaceae bacterium]